MPTLNDMSEQEIEAYVGHFRATMSSLSSALALFHFKAMNGATPLERNEAAVAAIETRRDMDLAEMQFGAATRKNGSVRAPTAAEVAQSVQRAEDLAKVNALGAKVSAFLKVASDASKAFTALHPGGLASVNSKSAEQALAALDKAAKLLPEA